MNWTAPGGPALEDCDLPYSIMETPFHRDVVKELCDAGHRHGIKIDLYFSNPDWYDADFRPYGYHPALTPGATAHPDLYGHAPISERPNTIFLTAPDPTPAEEARMMARHRQQLTELLTNYGKIDMLVPGQLVRQENWPAMRETVLELRKMQPDVMLRARGIGNYGDYYTPEGFVPGGKENTDMPWFVIYPARLGLLLRSRTPANTRAADGSSRTWWMSSPRAETSWSASAPTPTANSIRRPSKNSVTPAPG